jgi:hypothetical protein
MVVGVFSMLWGYVYHSEPAFRDEAKISMRWGLLLFFGGWTWPVTVPVTIIVGIGYLIIKALDIAFPPKPEEEAEKVPS